MSSHPPFSDEPPTIEGGVGSYPPPGPPPPQVPPQMPPYQAPPMPPAAPMPGGSGGGLAIAGLVLALLSMACLISGIGLVLFRHAAGLAALVLFCGLPLGVVGIVLAAVGRPAPGRRQGSGTAGLILSTLAVVLTALFLLAGLAAAARAGGVPGRFRPRQRPQPQGHSVPVIVRLHVPFDATR